MMRRRYRRSTIIRDLLALLAIPLALSGVGYALFTQQLTINTTTDKVAYSSSQNLLLTYTKTVTKQTSTWAYSQVVTVKNTGTQTVNSWTATFKIPTDATAFSCTPAICVNTGGNVTVTSDSTNSILLAGASVTFTLNFTTTTATYSLQDINISGVLAPTYQTVAGLTVTATPGARVRSGTSGIQYYWPYTFRITNTSGRVMNSWRITANWNSTTNNITNVVTTVNYLALSNQLMFTSKTAIASGGTFQFTARLWATTTNWSLTGTAVQGV